MSETDNPILEPAKLFYPESTEGTSDSITETVDISEDEPTETEEVEAVEESAEEVETDEVEESDGLESNDDSENALEVFVIGDREISVEDIEKWEQGFLRQSDYTKKTQKLAEERRAFEADRDKEVDALVNKKLAAAEDNLLMLEQLVKEADEAIDWDDLREYDIGEYTKQKEIKEKRLNAIESAKQAKAQIEAQKIDDPGYIAEQQQLLLANNPEWIDAEGKTTDAHKKDLETLSKYLASQGFTAEEQNKITSARDWQVFIDASKYRASKEKTEAVRKKVKKIPVTTKPKKVAQAASKTAAEKFYGKS